VDGQRIPQSMTIVRLLAKQFNLAGKDNLEQAKVDSVADTIGDLSEMYSKLIHRGKGQSKKEEDSLDLDTDNSGMFCPGGSGSKVNVSSKKLKSGTESEPADSPDSVGMAIDISTGALLLSVLKLSKDAWGTHVIVSIKVGEMNEHQIQFKNCIRYTTEVSDGLIKTILEDNLEQELLEK
ncbi:unnamed protein product, partial [Didymodactylos carnosus]